MSWRKAFDQAREFASENDDEVRKFVAGTKGIKQLGGFEATPGKVKRPSSGELRHERPEDGEEDQDSDKEGGFRQPKKLAKFVEHEQFDVPAAYKAQDKSALRTAKQQKRKKNKKLQQQQQQQQGAIASVATAAAAAVEDKKAKKPSKASKSRPEGSSRRGSAPESGGVVGMEV